MAQRAHYRRTITTDGDVNVVTDIVVRVYNPGTTVAISDVIYAASSGSTELSQPITFSDGTIEFFLADPRRVRVGITPPGSGEFYLEDVDVPVPAGNAIVSEGPIHITNTPTATGDVVTATSSTTAQWAAPAGGGGSDDDTEFMPLASEAAATIDLVANNVTGIGQMRVVQFANPDDAVLAFGIVGDAHPRWLFTASQNDGFFIGSGAIEPRLYGACFYVADGGSIPSGDGLHIYSGLDETDLTTPRWIWLDSDLALNGTTLGLLQFPAAGSGVRRLRIADDDRLILEDPDAGNPMIIGGFIAPIRVTASSTTLAAAHIGAVIETNNAGANTILIPHHSTGSAPYDFKIGTVVNGMQYGAGQTTITGDSGVTVHNVNSHFKSSAQWAEWTMRKVDQDVWVVSGALSA